jgi:hypothetical protein
MKSYTNGTVAITSENGEVHMQSESVSISGSLKVNGLDVKTKFDELMTRIEELGDNVVKYNLDCDKSGTQNVSFDVQTQVFFGCNCKEGYSGYLCQTFEEFTPRSISSLVHWLDFSSIETYGNADLSKLTSFVDAMGNMAEATVNGNVGYKVKANGDLNAIYVNASKTALTFKTSKAGKNPEIFLAYRVISQTSENQGILFNNDVANSGGYAFGSYKQDTDYVGTIDVAGERMTSKYARYSEWHVANIFFGEASTDGFLEIDGGGKESFGISGKYQAAALTLASIGGSSLSTNHHAENYIGEVLIFNAELTADHRSLVRSYLLDKWTNYATINGVTIFKDMDGWLLLLAYKHVGGESKAQAPRTAPTSPTEGYSHIWLNDLGLSASDVDSVRFYCKTSGHSRVMHFSANNDWIKSAIVTGSASGNTVSYWNSGTKKFSDHTANLPDNAYMSQVSPYCPYEYEHSDACPFSLLYKPMNGLDNSFAVLVDDNLKGAYINDYSQKASFLCDDNEWDTTVASGKSSVNRTTLHQIWFKLKEVEPPRAEMTLEDCKAQGGETLTYNYKTSSWQCLTPAVYPHYRDSWFRSPYLYGNASYPTTDVILAYLANQTGLCRREVYGENYKNCENPETDWREVYIVNPDGQKYGESTFTDENCTFRYIYGEPDPITGFQYVTKTLYENAGKCNFWRCYVYQSWQACADYDDCDEQIWDLYEVRQCGPKDGGDGAFYGLNKTMITVSEKYYRFELGRKVQFTTKSHQATRFYAQMKGTTELLYFGEGIGTSESYSSLNVPETGDYRIVAVTISESSSSSVYNINDEGAMLHIQSIRQDAPASCGISGDSSSFWSYICGGTGGCCPYVPGGDCGYCGNFYPC